MDVGQQQRARTLVAERLEQPVQARCRPRIDQHIADLPAADHALASEVLEIEHTRLGNREHLGLLGDRGRLVGIGQNHLVLLERRLIDDCGLGLRFRHGGVPRRGLGRQLRRRNSLLGWEAGRGRARERSELVGQLAYVRNDPVALCPDMVDLRVELGCALLGIARDLLRASARLLLDGARFLAGARQSLLGLGARLGRQLLGGLMRALEDLGHLFADALKRPADGALGRAARVELGYELRYPPHICVDREPVVAAQRDGKVLP